MKKKFGLGSLSLLFVIVSFVWSFEIFGYCLGDEILSALHFQTWSNGKDGIHYTVFYAYLFLLPALLLSIGYKDDLFAAIGKRLAYIFIGFLLFASLFMVF